MALREYFGKLSTTKTLLTTQVRGERWSFSRSRQSMPLLSYLAGGRAPTSIFQGNSSIEPRPGRPHHLAPREDQDSTQLSTLPASINPFTDNKCQRQTFQKGNCGSGGKHDQHGNVRGAFPSAKRGRSVDFAAVQGEPFGHEALCEEFRRLEDCARNTGEFRKMAR